MTNPENLPADEVSQRLQDKLLEYWWQPNTETMLSQELSDTSKLGANLHDPIMAMLESWEQGKPSALRTALHLVNAANVTDQKVIDMLIEVLRTTEVGIWIAVTDPACPQEILSQFVNDEDGDVRIELAGNPNMPSTALEQLAIDEDRRVRWGVAKNPNTPTIALEQLATDQDLFVRQSVARNPNTPTTALEKLATDQKLFIRQDAARNPNYMPETHPTYPRLVRPRS